MSNLISFSLISEFGVPVISKSKLDSKMFYVLKEDKKKPLTKPTNSSVNPNRANILQPLTTNRILSCNNRTDAELKGHSFSKVKGHSEPKHSEPNQLEKSCIRSNALEPIFNRSNTLELCFNRSNTMEPLGKECRSLKSVCNSNQNAGSRSNVDIARTLPRALLKCKRNREMSRAASAMDKENVVPHSDTRVSSQSLYQGSYLNGAGVVVVV